MLRSLSILLLLGSCGEGGTESAPPRDSANEAVAPAAPNQFAPPTPNEPSGLTDDRAPVAEKPIDEKSAEGAAQVLQTYYALIEAGRYDEAWALRSPGASGPESKAAFVRSFAPYAEYHATIGTPGPIQGAAGSLYVEVPVQTYGRMKEGTPFSSAGTVTLRRANDVPGSTAAQRRWHIYARD